MSRQLEGVTEVDYLAPEFAHSALLTIDLQQDFLGGGAFEVTGTSLVLPQVIRLARAYRQAQLPVVHAVRLYASDGKDVDVPRRALIEGGLQLVAPESPGSQLAQGLLASDAELDSAALVRGEFQELGKSEWIMFKPRWGAFYRTRLDDLLRSRGNSTVVVVGCNLPNCPRASLFEASERDYRTVLVEDAVSQCSDERIADLAAIGVRILQTAEVLEAIAQLS